MRKYQGINITNNVRDMDTSNYTRDSKKILET